MNYKVIKPGFTKTFRHLHEAQNFAGCVGQVFERIDGSWIPCYC